MCKLSIEVVDLIIQATVAHGIWVTAKCALVCHDWHIISRRHVFHTVELTTYCPCSPSPVKVLRSNPHLYDFIRQVNIRFDGLSQPIIHDLEVLKNFKNVRELDLQGHTLLSPASWEAVPYTIISMPSLLRLSLKAWAALKEQVFTSIMSRCSKNLHHLIIDLAVDITPTNNKIVTMDALSVLELRCIGDGFPAGRSLRCPKLHELIVDLEKCTEIKVSFPFVTADLRHLIVKAGPYRLHRLLFKKKIGVSHLTICAQRVYGSFSKQIVWTSSFARAFTAIRPVSRLSIRLEHRLPNDCSYPKAREYKPLCNSLRELCRRDKPTCVDIKIQLVSIYQRVKDFQAFKAGFWKEVTEGFSDLFDEETEFNLSIEKVQAEMVVW